MALQKAHNLLNRRLNQHGLGRMVHAGLVCEQAMRLYPGLFQAISAKNGILHLGIERQKQTDFLLVRGKLLQDIQTYCKANHLPPITRIKLTISSSSATV